MEESIILGGGCFWCVEAIYVELKGVQSAVSGYAGGHVENPTYEQVCGKQTGHAEVVDVRFDTDIISLREILEIFFVTHDPTTPNRQGNDVGPQYRSVVYYQSEEQRTVTEEVIARFEQEQVWNNPIVTEIEPLKTFYRAEDYHQNYFARNPTQGYCNFVILPKVTKFRKQFFDKLKQ
ncbi:MAG: peptide-methionine (S)-S-oxide reductase MsrA [Candidatus Kariarchaeaceae archaeon]|jgi:peptide-methionine (S)-S-oxide reductase